MEFSCGVLDLQFLQGMGVIHKEKILYCLLLFSKVSINKYFKYYIEKSAFC